MSDKQGEKETEIPGNQSGVSKNELEAIYQANNMYGDLVLGTGEHLLSHPKGGSIIDSLEENWVDSKTGVKNQRDLDKWLAFDEKAHEVLKNVPIERRKSGAKPILHGVMIFLDVDGLGAANNLGHDYGDKLLQTVAQSARDIAQRPEDSVWRRGDHSDEFVIALPGSSFKDFEKLEVKFQDALQKRSAGKAFSASMIMGSYGYTTTARQRLSQLDEVFSAAKARAGKGAHIETIFDKSNG